MITAPIPPDLKPAELDGLANVYMGVAGALRTAADKYEKTARECLARAKGATNG